MSREKIEYSMKLSLGYELVNALSRMELFAFFMLFVAIG